MNNFFTVAVPLLFIHILGMISTNLLFKTSKYSVIKYHFVSAGVGCFLTLCMITFLLLLWFCWLLLFTSDDS